MSWVCPCTGCNKARKAEQERIASAIEAIKIEDSKTNALGMKLMAIEIARGKNVNK